MPARCAPASGAPGCSRRAARRPAARAPSRADALPRCSTGRASSPRTAASTIGIAAVDQQLRARAGRRRSGGARSRRGSRCPTEISPATSLRSSACTDCAPVTTSITCVACASCTSQRARCVPARSATPGAQVAHVLVDRVAEQDRHHQRHAGDHPAGEPVAAQVAELLARDRGDARERARDARFMRALRVSVGRVAATNTSSRLARASATCASTPRRRAAPRASCATGSASSRSTSACSRVPSCATLCTAGRRSSAVARRAQLARPRSRPRRVDLAHQPLGRARRDQPPAVEDREPVAALGLVHVVGRDEDRRAALDQPEQALPEVAPALRIDGAGRLVEEQELGLVQGRARPARAAGAGRPRACRRAGRARSRRWNSSSSAAMRARRCARRAASRSRRGTPGSRAR